ncbi:hypothetical protein [Pelotomaculum sp. FP]|uniref:hypothetical protein n=1 Tax=Pelotomaculum sp. FP TaxID=261474 RepID=UPI001292A89D|nr:hypothetical protein [Pelotomaculum sp. FP]
MATIIKLLETSNTQLTLEGSCCLPGNTAYLYREVFVNDLFLKIHPTLMHGDGQNIRCVEVNEKEIKVSLIVNKVLNEI